MLVFCLVELSMGLRRFQVFEESEFVMIKGEYVHRAGEEFGKDEWWTAIKKLNRSTTYGPGEEREYGYRYWIQLHWGLWGPDHCIRSLIVYCSMCCRDIRHFQWYVRE